MIAALYVMPRGVYYGLPGVDPWDELRDARLYPGPYPVIAHPPCARWGRYWFGGPHPLQRRREMGDDGGCFAAALAAVRRWGGVLEHPEASHAWDVFRLVNPPRWGGWIPADDEGGWTCCVEQGHYGHACRKATWLYAVRTALPSLRWGPSEGKKRMDMGYHTREERRKKSKNGPLSLLSARQRLVTPVEFRDLLIQIAEGRRE